MANIKENCEIHDVEISAFTNSRETEVIRFSWTANIGFGEYLLYKRKDDDHWRADSECMDKGEDKWFLRKLMDKFIDQVEVE